MDSKRLRDLREAYGSIYEPELELTEEQVWEEVESWVSSLIEDGYDLSDYTWEEMYEAYIEEQGGGIYATKPAPAKREVVNLPKVKGAITGGNVTLNRGYASTLGGQKGEVTYQKKDNVVTRRFRPTGMSDIRGSKAPGSNTPATTPATKSAITPATTPAARGSGGAPRPSIAAPAKASPTPTKPAATAQTGDKAKGMAIFAKANPALAAAAAERARTRGTSATTNPLMGDMKSRMPAPSTPSPTTTSTAFSKSTPSLSKPMSSSSNYSSAKVSPSANVVGKKDQKSLVSSYEWGSTSKLVEGIADAYSSIYEAKKVDQDKDGDNDFADVRVARLIASGVSKEEAIRRVKDKSYNEEVEIDEATRMRKELGKEGETATRNELASRSKAYQRSGSVDRTIAAAERGAKNPYVARGKNETEAEHNKRKQEKSQTLTRLASNRRGSVRDKPRAGLRGYAAKVEGSDRDLQSARSSARSAGTLTPAEKKGLGEDFELWVNGLVEEGYDLSDYTWDEMAEIYEETELEKKEAKEAAIAARRARVAQLQSQGRVMTSAKRTSGAAAQKKEAKRADALERAANAILRQTTGSSGKVSDKPMGSVAPAPKEQAPEANRRLKTGLRRDTLGTAADDALKGVKKEEYEIYEAILDYLLENNFADTQDNADVIIENMSEEWAYEILEGYKKLPVAKMIKQAAYKAYYASKDGDEKVDKQVAKMARVASRHSTIKGKAKVRGEGQALLNKIRGEK